MSGIFLAALALSSAAAGGGDPTLTVTCDPSSSSGSGTSGGSCPPVEAMPVGGNGAYAYQWQVTNADPDYPLTINSPNAKVTGFTFADVANGDTASASVRVTVTSGGQVARKTISVSFANTVQPAGGSEGGGWLPPDPPPGTVNP